MLQFATNGVFGSNELDLPRDIDLANPGDMPFNDRKGLMPESLEVRFESDAVGRMTEKMPEPISKDSWISGPVLSHGERSARLLKMLASKESIASSANRSKVGTTVSMNADLPGIIEAFDGRVSSGLLGGVKRRRIPRRRWCQRIWERL